MGNGRFPDNHFPGQTFPGQDVSRTRRFPDKTFPGQDGYRTRPFPDNHFPGQNVSLKDVSRTICTNNFEYFGTFMQQDTAVRLRHLTKSFQPSFYVCRYGYSCVYRISFYGL